MLQLFKQMVSSPLSGCVLRTPQHKSPLPMSKIDDPSDHAHQSLGNKDVGPCQSPKLKKEQWGGGGRPLPS
jgi:hypothetical protein